MRIGKLQPLRLMKPLRTVEALPTLDDEQRAEDELLRSWTQRVGEARAHEAMTLYRALKAGAIGKLEMKRTLPELLAEGWVKGRGANYAAQFDLGWSRPDLVLWNVPAIDGAMVWRIQGDYWHNIPDRAAGDVAQRARLLTSTARGVPIAKVIDIWESDIYASDSIFDRAYRGEESARTTH